MTLGVLGARCGPATVRTGRPRYVASMLTPGTSAPPFSLPDQDGNAVSLLDYRGRWLLLWWYPKAATPG